MATETYSVLDTTILTNDEGPSPQFAFVDDKGQPRKLKLGLRKLTFDVELSRLHLPKDTDQQLHEAMSIRQTTIEGRYRLVCL